MGLADYKKKRHFERTPEPKGRVSHTKTRNSYVIQKHAASRLHYDVRLELNGTLKSWAVPKGPSLDPAQKRLAVHVEDHPIDYGSFEGVIPEGEYGGGTVMLWDRGTWKPREDAKDTYEKGRLKFQLGGERLKGGWTLVRMKGRGNETADNWLMIKEHDEHATASPAADPTALFTTSVATGRSMEDIASQRKKVWSSTKKPAKPSTVQTRVRRTAKPKAVAIEPGSLTKAHKAPLPSTFKPQLATLVAQTPDGDDWLHEIKFDGYRLVCFLDNGHVRLETRSGLDWTGKFPTLAAAAATLPLKNAILDGEAMIVRADGTSDFQALQNLLDGEQGGRLVYQLFDLPYCEGYDLTRTPLIERKQLLKDILSGLHDLSFPLRYTEHIQGRGPEVFHKACGLAMEGLISKQSDSPYVQKRSTLWVKSKCTKRQELVIGGYTDPSGSRKGFGALLLGYYDKKHNLQYAGRVGTGFTETRLRELLKLLQPREIRKPPFHTFPSTEPRRGIHWVKPDLVAEVEFTDWTSDGLLRHPSFQGLRKDKPAKQVVRERAVPVEPAKQSARPPTAARKTSKGRTSSLQLSNPQRILYPELEITKEQLAEYYLAVADWILPHISKRPLALVRCPEGHQQGCFYQKHVTDGMPDSIHGVRTKEKEGITNTIYIQDLDALIGLVQLGVLEIHPWGTRIEHLDTPDRLVFDLDPAPDVKWPQVVEAAHVMRDLLQHLGLKSFLKTTGGKGLHVVVPIEPTLPWDDAKAFTKAIAAGLARHAPTRYIDVMTKSKRSGKIFVDYLRNGYGATSVAAYSTRARVGARVSTPIRWEESADVSPESFTLLTVPGRVRRLKKDPWHGFFTVRQSITPQMRRQAAQLER